MTKTGGRHAAAATVLEASLEVYDSHVARRLLGDCFLALQDTAAAAFQYRAVSDAYAFEPGFPPVPLP